MRTIAVLGFAALLLGSAHRSGADPITYVLLDTLGPQNGFTFSGTITTDGTIGPLTEAGGINHITSWFIQATGPTTLTWQSGVGDNRVNPPGVTATATEILLSTGAALQFIKDESLDPDEDLFADRFSFDRRFGRNNFGGTQDEGTNGTFNLWLNDGFFSSDPQAVAVIPEPATSVLLLVGLACFAAAGRQQEAGVNDPTVR